MKRIHLKNVVLANLYYIYIVYGIQCMYAIIYIYNTFIHNNTVYNNKMYIIFCIISLNKISYLFTNFCIQTMINMLCVYT